MWKFKRLLRVTSEHFSLYFNYVMMIMVHTRSRINLKDRGIFYIRIRFRKNIGLFVESGFLYFLAERGSHYLFLGIGREVSVIDIFIIEIGSKLSA